MHALANANMVFTLELRTARLVSEIIQ
jgi:hypothetical protein